RRGRQRCRRQVRNGGDLEELQELPDALFRRPDAVETGEDLQVLPDGEIGRKGDIGGRKIDPLQDAPTLPGDVPSENASRAGSGRRQPEEQLNRRRLSRPVRPEETEDLPPPHFEGQPVYGQDVTEALGQALDLDDARAHGPTR